MLSKYTAQWELRSNLRWPLWVLAVYGISSPLIGIFGAAGLYRWVVLASGLFAILLMRGIWNANEWARWVSAGVLGLLSSWILLAVTIGQGNFSSLFLVVGYGAFSLYLLLPSTRTEFNLARKAIEASKPAVKGG